MCRACDNTVITVNVSALKTDKHILASAVYHQEQLCQNIVKYGGTVCVIMDFIEGVNLADKLKAEHGDEVDAILIFIGTNDYNAGVPIGEWFTERPEKVMAGIHEEKHLVDRRHRYPVMTDSTYRGRINKALDYVKRLYPTKQIILLTPIHRAEFYANDKNWQPREDFTNQCGEYIDAYVQSVKEAGNLWAVPVIDMNALSGLYPLMDEYAQFFKSAENDRLHPNDEGHRRMALVLMHQLQAYPIF